MELIGSLVYREPSSIYATAVYVATMLGLAGLGVTEFAGKHLQYSKFSKKSEGIQISSKIGMLILYTPAMVAGVLSFWIFPDGGIRFLLVKSAVTIQFLKRDLEVLFVHKFSGSMGLNSVIIISTAYLSVAAGIIYFQYLTLGSANPSIDLMYFGVLVFLLGICINFYHHYLLANLRKEGEKGYKIPTGGLFNLIICPHYLFEIITFVGIFLIGQTIFSCLCALGVGMYLSGRSRSTRNWYLSKFEDFPRNVKALIPYVF